MGLFKDCGCGCNGKKQEKKMFISLMSAALFYIVANPKTFLLLKNITGINLANSAGCPTGMGLLIHALVFFLVTWGLMNI
jgi:hypothetical protein